jgi:serine phosphatase RsbU (regulator of sigma subunit)
MVIHLSDLWNAEAPEGLEPGESVRVIRVANVSAFVPRDWQLGQVAEVVAPVLDALIEAETGEGHSDFEKIMAIVGEQLGAQIEAAVEASALEAEQRPQLAELREEMAADKRQHLTELREAMAAEHEKKLKMAPQLELEREFGCAVRREGEVVGNVRARVDARRVLQSVLERTEAEQGEIPFAMDADGNLYTNDEHGRRTIEDLGLLADLDRSPGGSRVISDEWVAVARDEPELGLTFGIARPVGEHLGQIRRATGRNLMYGLALVSLAMFGIIPLSSRMTRNVTSLTDGVERLADGDLSTRVPVRTKDEIGRLGGAFNRMAEQLSDNQRKLVEQERLHKELELCRQIQEELLPRRSVKLPFAELRAVSIPAREVGGDFFNYFPLPDGSVALLMGDVSGKGMPAALLMANVQATLRARLPLEPDLACLADSLDREMEASTPPESFLTLFVAIVEPGARRLRYVNAGHNLQYLAGAGGKFERMESSGRPLGLLSGGGYREQSVELCAGDVLCLFTDGLIEAENSGGVEFGEKRLEKLLCETGTQHPDAVLARIEEELRDHRGQVEAADDATVLILRVRGDA